MKVLSLILIVVTVCLLYGWVNGSSGAPLSLSELLPFSKSGHSFTYNYLSLVLIGVAGWGIWRIRVGRRSR